MLCRSTEKTDLPYASKVRTKNDAGQEVGVMHACGHDVHMTSMLGTAKMLSELKDQWRGTLVIVGQPAEETIDGARAMVKDGFFTRFPKPDFAIALHDSPDFAAGTVGLVPGYALASSTNVDIKIRGVGGHGSRPESAKDPIVLAAQIVLGLQTIVSRENSPLDPAVVTVGSIHGGTRYNIIPDEVNLQLTVRAYKEEVRQKLLAAIERVTKGIAGAAGIPAELAPIIKVSETEVTTATYNDPVLTERLAAVFAKALGPGKRHQGSARNGQRRLWILQSGSEDSDDDVLARRDGSFEGQTTQGRRSRASFTSLAAFCSGAGADFAHRSESNDVGCFGFNEEVSSREITLWTSNLFANSASRYLMLPKGSSGKMIC